MIDAISGSLARASEIGRELDRVVAVAFALEPRLAGVEFVETLGDDGKIGARDRVVETNHDVALLDAVAVAHAKFADDAAGRVLDLLDVRIDDDRALGDERPGQRHGPRPAADAAGQHDDDHQPGQRVAADGLGGCPDCGFVGFMTLRLTGFGHDLERAREAAAPSRCSTRAQHLVLRAEGLDTPLIHHQQQVDAGDARSAGARRQPQCRRGRARS